MTAHLPPSLLALFAPRPPLPVAPVPEKKREPTYSSLALFTSSFTPEEIPKERETADPFAFRQSKKLRRFAVKLAKQKKLIDEQLPLWNPMENPKATSDPTKTLFVGRLSYNISEHKLQREFDKYGPIKQVKIVTDTTGKPRGYAFIEFERDKDMRAAYRDADGHKIDGRRVVVDVERGRTVKTWRPRRLGGGKGFTRAGAPDANQRFSGREPLKPGEEDPLHGGERRRSRSPERRRSRSRERGERRDYNRDYNRDYRDNRDNRDYRERDRVGYERDRKRERDRVGSDRPSDRPDNRGDYDRDSRRQKR